MIYVHERGFGPLDKDIADQVLQKFGRLGALLHVDSDPTEWPESRENLLIIDYSPGAQKSLRKTVQYPEACSMALENTLCRHDALSSGIATMSLPEICKQYDLKPTGSTDALGSVVRFLMRKVYQQIPSRLRQLPSEYMLRRVRPEKET